MPPCFLFGSVNLCAIWFGFYHTRFVVLAGVVESFCVVSTTVPLYRVLW